MALVVAGMNDVLNSQGYTQAAWWNRIPALAWGLMIAIAFGCNFLVGYGARSFFTAKRLLFIFPAFIAIAFAFIADIDFARHGIDLRGSPESGQPRPLPAASLREGPPCPRYATTSPARSSLSCASSA